MSGIRFTLQPLHETTQSSRLLSDPTGARRSGSLTRHAGGALRHVLQSACRRRDACIACDPVPGGSVFPCYPSDHEYRPLVIDLSIWSISAFDLILHSPASNMRLIIFISNILNAFSSSFINTHDSEECVTTSVIKVQHDGAPPHFSLAVREHLDRRFEQRWIGRGGPIARPPRSPDLTPLDFFLWGRMKSLVYETPIETAEDLVARVVVAAGEIADTPGVEGKPRKAPQPNKLFEPEFELKPSRFTVRHVNRYSTAVNNIVSSSSSSSSSSSKSSSSK
ncbi:hypothetical protein ANN_19366 [Periplaneta americana]|uniref:Uncharacterized protein n=1 Tax=Periplaneta americana TaxID=6978 RepID=A0ABQ8SAC2_PERAM|nr:hypothetical protein ANN_19366 [Periplaneta americana]